jgi:hypothetical protein
VTTSRSFKKPARASDDFLRSRLEMVQRRLDAEYRTHLSTRQHNFDSGLPLEDAFRAELAELLKPFVVEVGRVVDRERNTAGECDIVIVEPRLSPLLLTPPSPVSRKKWFTFESTYGIVEVKQTLSLGATDPSGALRTDPSGTMWDACSKIFAYKQLVRNERSPIRWGTNAPIGIVVCYDCDLDASDPAVQDTLMREFVAINSLVDPQHRVNAIYVLGKFYISWCFLADPAQREFRPLQHPHEAPGPVWASFHLAAADTLYCMFLQLWDLLTRTQLHHPDLLRDYGGLLLVGTDMRAFSPNAAERARLGKAPS